MKKLDAHKQGLFAFILDNLQNPLNNLLGFTRVITENIESYSKEEIKSNRNLKWGFCAGVVVSVVFKLIAD